ncbi:neuroligin-4, X-linked-like [Saccostrea cucullata]|uniref:neuroligin-4, X-linked-like n=1 Tax=Saccostrea cuccullata TaxID=36930 RepID=UPI002ED0A26C
MNLEFIGSIFIIYGRFLLYAFSSSMESPVRISQSGKIRGRITERVAGFPVEEYLGIPYAAPPIGANRFQRPREHVPWTDTLNATKLPPACYQGEINAGYIKLHMPEFDMNYQNEDCLFLNIYVPKSLEKNVSYAVMFYIHGGSNRAGMGAMLPGDILAAHGQIIVINFNYRLGLLGFLSSPQHNFTGNNGLLDQVAAMRWVHSNIHYFDGDRDRITIAGHSAGAGDVGLHLVSPLTKGLFRNAILMSGSPLAHWAMASPDQFPGSNINATILQYALDVADIRTIDIKDIKAIEIIFSTLLPFSVVPYPAVVDNYFLTKYPRSSFQNGDFHGNKFLVSFTADESFGPLLGPDFKIDFPGYLVRYEPFYPTICNFKDTLISVYSDIEDPGRRLVEAEADMLFYASIIELSDLLSDSDVKPEVNVFEYDIKMPKPNQANWEAVDHGEDIFYLFGIPLIGSTLQNFTEKDIEASELEMTLYSNFVKTELFSMDGLTRLGRLYNEQHRSYCRMYFDGNNVTFGHFQNFRKSKMEFWNEVEEKKQTSCDKASKANKNYFDIYFLYSLYITVLFLKYIVQ